MKLDKAARERIKREIWPDAGGWLWIGYGVLIGVIVAVLEWLR